MKECLFFDLDGTLIDSSQGIFSSIRYSLAKINGPTLEEEQLRSFIGPPLADSFKKIGLSDKQLELAVRYYRENYAKEGIKQIVVYEGIPEALAKLSETKTLYLATSKPEHFAEEILAVLGFEKYFTGIYGADMEGKRAAKADVLAYALEAAAIDKEAAVMIGDRKHDILGGKANGLATAGVLYGFGSQEELAAAGAEKLFATPQAVADYFSLV